MWHPQAEIERYYDQATGESKTEMAGTDSDGTTYPVALRRIEV